jgi:hypothetical protein
MGSMVQLLKAAYSRVDGNDANAMVSAMLDKPQNDTLVNAFAILFYIAVSEPTITPLDCLDRAIAQAADLENITTDGDPQMQEMADYLLPSIADIPQPIPRSLLQPFGIALVSTDAQPDRATAVAHLLATYQFA